MTPSHALQTNTPGCHGPCFLPTAFAPPAAQGPRQPGVSLSLGSLGVARVITNQ